MRGERVLMAMVAVSLNARAALAQYDYDVAPERPVWLRALLDVRLSDLGRAPAWTDRGPGKVRYGGRGTSRGFDRVVRFSVGQAAIELGGSLPWGVTARAQLNWETDIDQGGDWPNVIEAQLRKEWGEAGHGLGIQAGVMNVPFSMEHTGPAWTPLYMLSASAQNTWIWEELRLVGAEMEWWRMLPGEVRLDLLAGFGFGPDELGWLLSERGWVMTDHLTGINRELPIPRDHLTSSVFDERDRRPAYYAMVSLRDPWKIGELRSGYFDNNADQDSTGTWDTDFHVLGMALRPFAHVEALAQYMSGEVHTEVNHWDGRFQAYYVLASLHYRMHRLSFRWDDFRVHDLDGGPRFSGERGRAVTLAYLLQIGLYQRLGIEYILPHSDRPQLFHGDPADDGWQISYRLRY